MKFADSKPGIFLEGHKHIAISSLLYPWHYVTNTHGPTHRPETVSYLQLGIFLHQLVLVLVALLLHVLPLLLQPQQLVTQFGPLLAVGLPLLPQPLPLLGSYPWKEEKSSKKLYNSKKSSDSETF